MASRKITSHAKKLKRIETLSDSIFNAVLFENLLIEKPWVLKELRSLIIGRGSGCIPSIDQFYKILDHCHQLQEINVMYISKDEAFAVRSYIAQKGMNTKLIVDHVINQTC